MDDNVWTCIGSTARDTERGGRVFREHGERQADVAGRRRRRRPSASSVRRRCQATGCGACSRDQHLRHRIRCRPGEQRVAVVRPCSEQVKWSENIAVRGVYLTATGTHVPCEITQRYRLCGGGDSSTFFPANYKAGTRFTCSYREGIQWICWVVTRAIPGYFLATQQLSAFACNGALPGTYQLKCFPRASLLHGGQSWKQQRPFKNKPYDDDEDEEKGCKAELTQFVW